MCALISWYDSLFHGYQRPHQHDVYVAEPENIVSWHIFSHDLSIPLVVSPELETPFPSIISKFPPFQYALIFGILVIQP